MNDKKLAAIVPMVLLVIVVIFAQMFVVPNWLTLHKAEGAATEPKAGSLQVLGYNYNKDLVELSVVVWNRGSGPINITGVSYDGLALKMGTVGSPNDLSPSPTSPVTNLGAMAMDNSSGTITSNDLIFPNSGQWNMNTGGADVPVITSNAMATLYLGVTSLAVGSNHTLVISSGPQQYAMVLQR